MVQIKSQYIFFILIIGLLIKNSDCFCSTGCTYVYNSTNYDFGCISTNYTSCTHCDPLFYYPQPVSGTCVLSNNIYNYTYTVAQNNWDCNIGTFTSNRFTVGPITDWLQLDTSRQYNQLIYINTPYYGFRCRVLFYVQNINNPNIDLDFIVNGTYTYRGQNVQIPQNYPYNQWIYTTPFIRFSEPAFRLMIKRNENIGDAAFNDVRCFFAYCTPNCLACNSTSDCSSCAAGYYFDMVTRLCINTCPLGRFSNVTNATCLSCDIRCQICTTSATNCTQCTISGPYQSFLQLASTTCAATCADGIPNYLTHKCQCGPQNFTINISTCAPCPIYCKYCSNITICIQCHIGFFMINGTTTCSSSCPPGQYINLIYDLKQCFLCDPNLCVQCVNSPSMCTSCAFPTLDRYLFNYTCLYICPDGYQGNNFTCDLCPLGTYSFQNVCYTQCPQYYYANDDLRACVLPGGYPLNMTVEVEGANTLRFTIPLPLGLSNSSLTLLATRWLSYISLSFITQNTSSLILNKRRTLLPVISQTIAISNAIITNNSIILYSSQISADRFIYTHSFMARFDDNLVSPKNVIYSIKAKTSTDDNPWFVSQYFDINLKPFFLIGIFLTIFGLLMILMRTKYVYRILIEYIHSIQLIGLTFYAIYPHSLHIDLYSFLMGLDFANFSFLFNLPAKFIPPCKECICLVSYNFAIGDMNWLRMMGPLIFCLTAMFIFCMVIYAFECSRKYSSFYLNLVIDLVLIKTIHGWFASLLFSGLNFSYDNLDLDLFVLIMHMLSYCIMIPIIYTRIKAQMQNKYLNISFIFLVIYIILITLLSIAPSIICALLILTSFTQWSLNIGLNIGQDQKPIVKQTNNKVVLRNQDAIIVKVHIHLLRLIKPITAFLIAIVIMADDQVVPIAVVSAVLAFIFIFIIVNIYFLYEHYKLSKVQDKLPAKSHSIMNQTKQDLKAEKETEIRDKQLRIYDEDDMDDDGVVGKRFRKTKIQEIKPTSMGARNSSQFFKNVQ